MFKERGPAPFLTLRLFEIKDASRIESLLISEITGKE